MASPTFLAVSASGGAERPIPARARGDNIQL